MGKPKVVNFELIPADAGSEPHQILLEMRRFHSEIDEARIALAWRINLTPDKDGHLVLGKCVKASDLQREFSDYDFVILLNREVWEDSEFTIEKKRALVDHELCHAGGAYDEEGPKYDERGRRVFRMRKHDIEEFQAIVHRHGCYKKDLEVFAETLLERRSKPLLDQLHVDGGTHARRRKSEAAVQ
jgi:hypothetical protein